VLLFFSFFKNHRASKLAKSEGITEGKHKTARKINYLQTVVAVMVRC